MSALHIDDVTVDPDEPYKNDLFNRQPLGKHLSSLLASATNPLTISLDGAFGTGKTTFTRMWKRHLELQGCRCIYFNAWENDFANEPLIPLVGELKSIIESGDYIDSDKSFARKNFDKLKGFAGILARRAVPIGVRIVTAGVIDQEDLEKALADFAEKVTEEQIESYEEDKAVLDKFREELNTLASWMKETSDFPLVIIIDELDRCKPTYAIALLERVKHLFEVPNICFVLAMDKEQLSHSVSAVYGQGFDAKGYLRRFISIEYALQSPEIGPFCGTLYDSLDFSDVVTGYPNNPAQEMKRIMLEVVESLSSAFDLSLRDIQQAMIRLRVVLASYPYQNWTYYRILPMLIMLREHRRKIYDAFFTLPPGDPHELLRLARSDTIENYRFFSHFFGIIYYYYKDERAALMEELQNGVEKTADGAVDRKFEYAKKLATDFAEADRYHDSLRPTDKNLLQEAIEFSADFRVG